MGDVAPRLGSPILPTSRCLHPKAQTVQLTAILLDDPISRGNEDIRRGASDLRGRRRSATRVLGLADLALFASQASNRPADAILLDDPISRRNEDIRRGASDLRGRRRSATRVLGLANLALFASQVSNRPTDGDIT